VRAELKDAEAEATAVTLTAELAAAAPSSPRPPPAPAPPSSGPGRVEEEAAATARQRNAARTDLIETRAHLGIEQATAAQLRENLATATARLCAVTEERDSVRTALAIQRTELDTTRQENTGPRTELEQAHAATSAAEATARGAAECAERSESRLDQYVASLQRGSEQRPDQ
jgi:chromosome segregation ATPase